MNYVNLLWQHDNGIPFNPLQWLGVEGRFGRKALPLSEGVLSFQSKYVMAFKMLLSWK